jgi:hypothetical protein
MYCQTQEFVAMRRFKILVILTILSVLPAGCPGSGGSDVIEKDAADTSSDQHLTELRLDLGAELPDVTIDVFPDGLPDQMAEIPDVAEFTPELPFDVPVELDQSDVGPYCGDNHCDDGEWCDTCPADCGECTVCGNDECEQGLPVESPVSCPEDCGPCGDGVCKKSELEVDNFCITDCGFACGDGICNVTESAVVEGEQDYCPVDCGLCYDGICGYKELTDPELADCKDADCSTTCGNGECSQGEDWDTCPVDCLICGDGICGKWGAVLEACPADCDKPCGDGLCSNGETADSCPADCGPCGDGICSIPEMTYGGCNVDCPPDCGNGECQPATETADTCPGDCGCTPDCNPDWECGEDDNGCGEPCGACPEGSVCVEHTCCAPDCVGKECGADGCGGECGPCPGSNSECAENQCICTPDCSGKVCGDDGCGASCGECSDGLFCTEDVCADGACDYPLMAEHCLITLAEGTLACLEGGAEHPTKSCQHCDPALAVDGWSPKSDVSACGTGGICLSGVCCPKAGNCAGKNCGDDGCGSVCGECEAGEQCALGMCIESACEPFCLNKECGDDGCGGTCGDCADNLFCTTDGCGDYECEHVIDPGFCLVETVTFGGQAVTACAPDGAEDPAQPCQRCDSNLLPLGWSAVGDGMPCGGGAVCFNGECCSKTDSCAGKDCGSDGCGGNCGSCLAGWECEEGICTCTPDCTGLSCGSDGCLGSCGDCPVGQTCSMGSCVEGCTNDCAEPGATQCLDSSTFEVCGDYDADPCQEWGNETLCPSGLVCVGGECACELQCDGKECGSDGCGGSCGSCSGGQVCIDGECGPPVLTSCEEIMLCAFEDCDLTDMPCIQACIDVSGEEVGDQFAEFWNCATTHCDPAGPTECFQGVAVDECESEYDVCFGPCTPSCAPFYMCGDDGCGGVCGTCTGDTYCSGHLCVVGANCIETMNCMSICDFDDIPCQDICKKTAGVEAIAQIDAIYSCIEGECGVSPSEACAQTAMMGECLSAFIDCQGCTPDCTGKVCGTDGCGGSCGICKPVEVCSDGMCVMGSCSDECKPLGAKSCAGNGYVTCGNYDPDPCSDLSPVVPCGANEVCESGMCVCIPSCADKECGSDGCSGTCGSCQAGYECTENKCTQDLTCDDGNGIDWDGCTEGKMSEFRVSTKTESDQINPVVAAFPWGGFIVVWENFDDDENNLGVFGQKFNSMGQDFGGEIQFFEADLDGEWARPRVAVMADGSLIVARQVTDALGSTDLEGRQFMVDGTPITDSFTLSQKTQGLQSMMDVGVHPAGLLATAFWGWQAGTDFEIFRTLVYPGGLIASGDMVVNSFAGGMQQNPGLAMYPDGRFVVVYDGLLNGTGNRTVHARLYANDGSPVGEAMKAPTHGLGTQSYADVTTFAAGYIVVWQSSSAMQDGNGWGIYQRAFGSDGNELTDEMQTNEETLGDQVRPVVAARADGLHVVVWQGTGLADKDSGIHARIFNKHGNPLTGQFKANMYTSDPQDTPEVATLDDGFVVVWQSDGQDEDGYGIFARRFWWNGWTCPLVDCMTGGDGTCPYGCDDLDFCTEDSCLEGVGCDHVMKGCDDLDACTSDSCDPLTADCSNTPIDCDDGNSCTVDDCSPVTGCDNTIVADDTPCDVASTCQGGICVECNDGNEIDWDGCTDFAHSEILVNLHTAGGQRRPRVAINSMDMAFITWQGVGPEDTNGVFGRIVSPAGTMMPVQFLINPDPSGGDSAKQVSPDVATLPNDSFIVTWAGAGMGETSEVFTRFYSPVGYALAPPVMVTVPDAAVHNYYPVVTVTSDGNFLVAWQYQKSGVTSGTEIAGQWFDNVGSAIGTPFRINMQDQYNQAGVQLASVEPGHAVAAWLDTATGTMLFARQLWQGTDVRLTSTPLTDSWLDASSAVALASFGDTGYAAAWQAQDISQTGIYLARYAVDGRRQEDIVEVNDYKSGAQQTPALAAFPDGALVVAWAGVGEIGGEESAWGINVRSYKKQLTSEVPANQASNFSVATITAPDIATYGNRGYLVVWESGANQDGDGEGIFMRRFYRDGATIPPGEPFSPPTECVGSCEEDAPGNPCTQDFCMDMDVCMHQPLVTGFPCGALGTCSGSVCLDQPSYCDDGNEDVHDGCFNKHYTEWQQVGGNPEDEQRYPRVASPMDGSFAVAWVNDVTGDADQVYFQAFDEWAVSTDDPVPIQPEGGAGFRGNVALAAHDDFGVVNYITTWTEQESPAVYRIYGRRAYPDGSTDADVFVGSPNIASAGSSSIAFDGMDGSFAIAFTTSANTVFYRRFGADLSTSPDSPIMLDDMLHDSSAPALRFLYGDLMAAWVETNQDADGMAIVARILDSWDQDLLGTTQFNEWETGAQVNPHLAATEAGYVMVWQSDTQDGDNGGVFAREIAGDGIPMGSEFQVNQFWEGHQAFPRVAALPGGQVAMCWTGRGFTDSSSSVFMRVFDWDMSPLTDEIRVNQFGSPTMITCDITATDESHVVVVWAAKTPAGDYDVQTLRMTLDGTPYGPVF